MTIKVWTTVSSKRSNIMLVLVVWVLLLDQGMAARPMLMSSRCFELVSRWNRLKAFLRSTSRGLVYWCRGRLIQFYKVRAQMRQPLQVYELIRVRRLVLCFNHIVVILALFERIHTFDALAWATLRNSCQRGAWCLQFRPPLIWVFVDWVASWLKLSCCVVITTMIVVVVIAILTKQWVCLCITRVWLLLFCLSQLWLIQVSQYSLSSVSLVLAWLLSGSHILHIGHSWREQKVVWFQVAWLPNV